MDKRLKDFKKTKGLTEHKFTNDEGRLITYFRLNGKPLESPSKLLSPIMSIQLKDIPPEVLKAAVERGSAVGSAIEAFVDKKLEIEKKYEPIFKQFLLFVKEEKIKPLTAEYFVLNEKLNYYGFVDLICEDKDGKMIAIEVKTRDVVKYPESYKANHLQNNYYKMVLKDIPFYLLSLDSKGRS
jgi:hypothetical protein